MALNTLGGLNKLNTLGGGSGGVVDLTSEELLMIAKSRGGAVGQVADELVHPERSILSTIGDGFKKAFKGFVDTISLPSEIMAGIISPDFTIGEAIDQNKRVTDAIWGDKNIFNSQGEPTTMQKVGNFIVRLPIDILTDPLTYVTFGASAGVLGLKSLPKVTLGLKAIEEAGLAAKAAKSGGVLTRALSQEGADVLKFAKNIQRQLTGTMSAENLKNLVKTGEKLKTGLLKKGVSQETLDFTENELKDLLKATVEAPLQPDWAKKAVSNLLDHNPALIKTMLDEGGIKFFGKTMLSGQRISSTMEMIPGMTLLDNFTQPVRDSVGALFDPAIVKANGEYIRLPEEYVGFRQQLKDLGESMHVDAFRNMSNVQKQLNLNKDEWRLVMDAMSIRKMPADPRLAKAYTTMLDLDEANLEMLQKAGVPIHNLENHTGLIFVPEDTRRVVKNSQFSKDVGAAQEAIHAKFIKQGGMEITDNVPELTKYAEANPESEIGKALGSAKYPEGTIYHGTKSSIESLNEADVLQYGKSNSLYGQGLYLTDNAKVAEGYSITKGVGEKGKILTGKIKSDVKLLNLDEKLSPKVIKIMEDVINTGNDGTLLSFKGKNGQQAMREFMNNLDGLTTSEGQGIVEALQTRLEDIGYDGFKHTGGQITGGVPSNVSILWEGGKRSIKDKIESNVEKIVSGGVQSPQELGFAIGRELDQKVKTIMKDGVTTLEEALKKPEIKKLQDMRDAVAKLEPNKELVGKADKLGLTKEETGFFIDENKNIFKRVAASATELERAGFTNFDTNLLTAYTTRTLQNQRQAIGQHFMEGLIRNFSKKIDEAPKSWLPIDNAGMFQKGIDIGIPLVSKEGAEYVFHPAIAKAYETMLGGITKDEISQGFWNGFDKLQRYWKASVTSIFPMFHGRNAISNVFLNMMDMGIEVFNPKTHAMSMDFIYKDRVANNLAKKMIGTGDEAVKASQEFTELMFKNVLTDKTGYTWTYGEIRKAIKDNNVAFTPNITGSTDVGDKESLAKFFGLDQSKTKQNLQKINPFNAEQNKLIRGGREVGRAIEEQARLTNFIANLRNTGDVTHAATRAKQFLFDYGNLTSFEKNVLRRLIPFYSFTKFNLQLQAKTLLTAPGRISAEIKTINSIAEVMGGEQLTDKEKSLLPSWMANSISLKRGEEIISGFGTPIEQPFQQFQPNSLLGSISPLFRYPVEAMTGYQFFRGKPTSDVIDAKNFREAPQAIKDFIGYAEYQGTTKTGKKYNRSVSLRPGNMNFINNLPWAGRISTIMGTMTDQNISDQAKSLSLITGVQARSADFQQLEKDQEELLRKQLEKILSDSGVRGSFVRSYTRSNTKTVE